MPVSDASLYSMLIAPSPQGLIATVGGAIYKAAVAIQNEAAGVANHTNRLAFANAVMNNVTVKLPEKARAMLADVLADGTISALPDPTQATDAQVEARVNGLLSVAASLANYGT